MQAPDREPPPTADDLAVALRQASQRGQVVVPWGAGTRQHIGNPPPPGARVLGTAALQRVIEHVPADMTVTVEAGIALGQLQATLGQHGQWLPWDPPSAATATIGGLLATAACGPLRLGYGAPRDWVLGMRVALGDGRLVRSGGKVVKNVAGYETHKLHVGALGTLGVIVEVTFKLFPVPERMSTLVIACADRSHACRVMARLRDRPLAPVSLLSISPAVVAAALASTPQDGEIVAVRFAGVAAAVERQAQIARDRAAELDAAALPLAGEQQRSLWQHVADFTAPGGRHVLLRTAAQPSALEQVLGLLEQHAQPASAPLETLGYGGVGVAFARWAIRAEQDGEGVAQALAALRTAVGALGGYVVVEDLPAGLRAALDVWGPPPGTFGLMRGLKQQWDPRGILNRGRYLV